MWFGTHDGLNRYDGYEFRVFRPSKDNPGSISSNGIRVISEDSSSNILVGTIGGGLNVFLRKEERFISYLHNKNDSLSLLNNNVIAICPIGGDKFWIGTDNGISIFHSKNGIIKNISPNDSTSGLSDKKIRSFCKVNDSTIWVGCNNGRIDIFSLDGKKKETILIDYNAKMCMLKDKYENVWVGTWGGGLLNINSITHKYRRYKKNNLDEGGFSSDIVFRNSISMDKMGRLWVGTWESGLNEILSKDANSINYIIKHVAESKNIHSLSDDFILSTYVDDNDILWVGTRGSGISKLDLFPKKFKNYIEHENQLRNTKIKTLYQDFDGDIWMGSKSGGIQILDIDSSLFHFFNDSSILSLGSIYGIDQQKKDSTYWIATKGQGILSYNKRTSKMQKYEMKRMGVAYDIHNTLIVDKYDNVWSAPSNGNLLHYNQKKDLFEEFLINGDSLSENQVQTFYEDNRGNIWIGTRLDGMYRFTPQKNIKDITFIQFKHNPANSNSLSHNNVNAICEDSKGFIWIGTAGGGLNKFDVQNNYFTLLNENDGLPNRLILSIVEDHNGELWLGMGQGIIRFNSELETFRIFDRRDGLITDFFFQNSALKSKDGLIYFGGDNGVVSVNPNRIMLNYSEPKLIITDFKLFNKSIRYNSKKKNSVLKDKPIYLVDEIELSYEDYLFSFEFAALNFSSPTKSKYEYKLEGFDKEWIMTDAYNRIATYTNLRDGEYVFKLRATNADGIWLKKPLEVKVTINPPFWERLWFILLVLLFLITITVSTVFYRMNQLKQRNIKLENIIQKRTQEIVDKNKKIEEQVSELEKLNATKDKFFSIIAHDLKSPFNALIGFSQIMKERYYELEDERKINILGLINKTSSTMFSLLVNLLNWARTQSGQMTMEPNLNGIHKMIEDNVHLLEASSKEKKIRIKIDFISDYKILCDRNMLTTVFRNLISNAIKYTNKGGTVGISAFELGHNVSISITDNGIGMSKEEIDRLFKIDEYSSKQGTFKEQGTGLGLIVCAEFVKMHGGEIKVYSSEGQGSTFTVILPKNNKKLQKLIDSNK